MFVITTTRRRMAAELTMNLYAMVTMIIQFQRGSDAKLMALKIESRKLRQVYREGIEDVFLRIPEFPGKLQVYQAS